MTDDRIDNKPERYGVPRWHSAFVDALAAREAAEMWMDDLYYQVAHVPKPQRLALAEVACDDDDS
jgi:capsid portal protein